jgi:hypothetical protein
MHQNPKAKHIENLANAEALSAHLVPDAVNVLGAAANLSAYSGALAFFAQPLNNLSDVTFAIRVPLIEPVVYALIGVWLQVSKSEIFELLFELPDAQSVREWRENLEGFLSDGASCLFQGVRSGAQSTKLVG